jgi:hypothetical protein
VVPMSIPATRGRSGGGARGQAAADLARELRAPGWHSGTLSIPEVLTGYGDLLAEPRYGPDDLPSAGYEKRLGNTSRTLALSWEPPDTALTGYTLVVTEREEYFRA